MEEAYVRMDSYVQIAGDQFVLSVRSGSEIGMSDRLFDMLSQAMQSVNTRIRTGELCFYQGQLMSSEDVLDGLVVLKTKAEGGNDYYYSDTQAFWWGTQNTTYCSGQYAWDCYDAHNSSAHYTNQVLAAMSLGAGCVSAWIGAGIAFIGITNEERAYRVGNAIYQAAQSGGVRIVTQCRPNGYGGR